MLHDVRRGNAVSTVARSVVAALPPTPLDPEMDSDILHASDVSDGDGDAELSMLLPTQALDASIDIGTTSTNSVQTRCQSL